MALALFLIIIFVILIYAPSFKFKFVIGNKEVKIESSEVNSSESS